MTTISNPWKLVDLASRVISGHYRTGRWTGLGRLALAATQRGIRYFHTNLGKRRRGVHVAGGAAGILRHTSRKGMLRFNVYALDAGPRRDTEDTASSTNGAPKSWTGRVACCILRRRLRIWAICVRMLG